MKKICICFLFIFSVCSLLIDFSTAQAYPGYKEVTRTWVEDACGVGPGCPNHANRTRHEYTEWCCQYKCVVLRKWTD